MEKIVVFKWTSPRPSVASDKYGYGFHVYGINLYPTSHYCARDNYHGSQQDLYLDLKKFVCSFKKINRNLLQNAMSSIEFSSTIWIEGTKDMKYFCEPLDREEQKEFFDFLFDK